MALSQADVECPLCLQVYLEPVALPCAHTFCRQCLVKAFSSSASRACPLCRTACFLAPESAPVNVVLRSIVEKAFPVDLAARRTEVSQAASKVVLPLFCLSDALFPGQPLALHLFEPRYRIMLERIGSMTGPGRRFGYISTHSPAAGTLGVVVELASVRPLPTGTYLVDARACGRFRVREAWVDSTALGLLCASVDMLEQEEDAVAVDSALEAVVRWLRKGAQHQLAADEAAAVSGLLPSTAPATAGGADASLPAPAPGVTVPSWSAWEVASAVNVVFAGSAEAAAAAAAAADGDSGGSAASAAASATRHATRASAAQRHSAGGAGSSMDYESAGCNSADESEDDAGSRHAASAARGVAASAAPPPALGSSLEKAPPSSDVDLLRALAVLRAAAIGRVLALRIVAADSKRTLRGSVGEPPDLDLFTPPTAACPRGASCGRPCGTGACYRSPRLRITLLSFWLAACAPLTDSAKQQLLACQSLYERLWLCISLLWSEYGWPGLPADQLKQFIHCGSYSSTVLSTGLQAESQLGKPAPLCAGRMLWRWLRDTFVSGLPGAAAAASPGASKPATAVQEGSATDSSEMMET